MKKVFILFGLFVYAAGISQEKEALDFKKNEIKLNVAFLVAGAFEGTYERILNEESAFGIALFVPIIDDIEPNFQLTPYYRYYFGKKPAAGFFAEGFGMLNAYDSYIYSNSSSNFNYVMENRTDFALGFGLGSKWITKKGFVFEINAGVGRNLFNSNDTDYEIVGRGAISFGYRF
ncbi:hypothetical protein SAMN05444396_103151 [Flavobacterium segetis]|uniref:DUF3575 domain-containing protein n=1 Tax=Flavobacterium segetis TaxID=271157 RepID=A0A1M5FYV0_9FLAO|nr:hypothetical protein [Flavobacterium segetis]SHF96658.1 hypothetical protein SAMN05444396_103151 [Flavobacterium segetis]